MDTTVPEPSHELRCFPGTILLGDTFVHVFEATSHDEPLPKQGEIEIVRYYSWGPPELDVL